jgi:hypothetical protein
MTPHALRTAALAALAALALALSGCGDKPRPGDKDKKDDPRPLAGDPTKGDPKAEVKVEPKVDVTAGVGKDAVEFLSAVGAGTAAADRLSAGFVRLVGQPAVFGGDKERGYSPSAAEGWLRAVGAKLTGMGPMAEAARAGDAAVFRGAFAGGTYFLRMVREGGGWKADWLSLTSAKVTGPAAPPTPDGVLQGFAAAAVGAAVCDTAAMPRGERVAAAAAGLTPSLRAALGPPLDGDQALGYSPAKLGWKLDEIGGKAEAVALTPAGDAAFRMEVTRAGGEKAAYLLKLAKGNAPGQWLVDAITPQ